VSSPIRGQTPPALRGRHIVVTGGSSGIGLAMVRRAVALGARVSVLALDDDDLTRLRSEPSTEQHGVVVVAVDVTDRTQVGAGVERAVRAHGPCDVLVTSAGIVRPGYFQDLPDSEFERHMAVNYFGTLWAIRAVVPAMVERRSGSIVAISSFAALVGVFGLGAYGPSKYAVRGLCETLRLELKPYGIHVACVFPTDVDTPMLAAEQPLHPPEQDAMQGKVKPIPPEAVVDAIVDGLAHGRTRIYPGRSNGLLARLAQTGPELTARMFDRAIASARKRR
jgi:3-dehydrosphinganine reductase